MRGILFTGGFGPDSALAERFIARYDIAIAADSGLEAAERAGIVPDLIVGDMDSLKDPAILDKYSPDRIRVWPHDKDYTDTEIALAAFAERGVDEVVLVGGTGGRIDHFLALRSIFDRPYCPALWLGDTSLVAAAGTALPSRGLRIRGLGFDDPVSVFSAGPGPHRARGTGFHWRIDDLSWESGGFSLSNRADGGEVEFIALEGRFFLVLPLASAISVERFEEVVHKQ